MAYDDKSCPHLALSGNDQNRLFTKLFCFQRPKEREREMFYENNGIVSFS